MLTKQDKSKNLLNGKKLKGFRQQNKMSQNDLGLIIGKNFRTVSSYEKGYYSIPNDIIEKLNKEYHLRLQKPEKVVKKVVKNTVKKTVKKTKGFSSNIYNIRKSMNMTLKQFAHRFKMPVSSLWNIENNISDKISAKSLKEMYKSGIDIITLFK